VRGIVGYILNVVVIFDQNSRILDIGKKNGINFEDHFINNNLNSAIQIHQIRAVGDDFRTTPPPI